MFKINYKVKRYKNRKYQNLMHVSGGKNGAYKLQDKDTGETIFVKPEDLKRLPER